MKILHPTDFSKNSITALEYAIIYSKLLEAELHIIYVLSTEDVYDDGKKKINKLLAGISAVTEGFISPITKVLAGFPATEINLYAKNNGIDLVVMGTKGYTSLKNMFIGSVAKSVSLKSDIPIIIIPDHDTKKDTKGILLAVDNQSLNNKSLFKLPLKIARENNEKIDILHVAGPHDVEPFDPKVFNYLNEYSGEIFIERGKDTIMAIKQFSESKKYSLIIMIRRSHNAIHDLLINSNTSEALAHTSTPLMIIPE